MTKFVRTTSPRRHWNLEVVLISLALDRGRFVVVHPCSTFLFSARWRHHEMPKLRMRKIGFFHHSRVIE